MAGKNYTTVDIAKQLNVASSTVARWIDDGKIKAFVTPGGHRRVNREDFLQFLNEHDMPIPKELISSELKKILVVDDDQKILNAIERTIKRRKDGVEIFKAENGFQANRAVDNYSPDLVILDIRLPGIDGLKICRMIKEKHKEIKVLAITGYDVNENRNKIYDSGADAFLQKPFYNKEMVQAIDNLFDMGSYK